MTNWGAIRPDRRYKRVDAIVPYAQAVLLEDVLLRRHEWPEGAKFGPRERQLLRHFLDRRIVSRDDAVELFWSTDPDGGPLWAERTVDIHVARLRGLLHPGWEIVKRRMGAWVLQPVGMETAPWEAAFVGPVRELAGLAFV